MHLVKITNMKATTQTVNTFNRITELATDYKS